MVITTQHPPLDIISQIPIVELFEHILGLSGKSLFQVARASCQPPLFDSYLFVCTRNELGNEETSHARNGRPNSNSIPEANRWKQATPAAPAPTLKHNRVRFQMQCETQRQVKSP